MDPDDAQLALAARLGTERIEFYTGPYAEHFGNPVQDQILDTFSNAGNVANDLGLGINAGHDLNLDNLALFCQSVTPVAEVSIGHAIISDALWLGLEETISRYRTILDNI